MDIFWEMHLNCRYISYQPMKHSYDKIICFPYFPFDQELRLTYRYSTKKVLNRGRIIFSGGCGSLVTEEFLKQPVGNSILMTSTRKCNVWSIQLFKHLKPVPNGQCKDLSFR